MGERWSPESSCRALRKQTVGGSLTGRNAVVFDFALTLFRGVDHGRLTHRLLPVLTTSTYLAGFSIPLLPTRMAYTKLVLIHEIFIVQVRQGG